MRAAGKSCQTANRHALVHMHYFDAHVHHLYILLVWMRVNAGVTMLGARQHLQLCEYPLSEGVAECASIVCAPVEEE